MASKLANAPACLQKCVILLRDRRKAFPSTPAGMAEVSIMIMQHFSHYMCYYYIMNCYNIMSGINKVLNVISYYSITLCAKPLLRYASVILLHYEPIITL